MAGVVGVSLLIGALLQARRAIRHFGTPMDVLSVYLLVWGGTLTLFAIPVIAYSTTPPVAWIGVYGAILSGASAAWFVGRRSYPEHLNPRDDAAVLRHGISSHRLRICWVICAAIGAAGMFSFVYAVSLVLPWSAIVTDPAKVREIKSDSATFKEAYGLLKLLTYFNQVAFVLWSIGLRIHAFDGRWLAAKYLGFASILPFFFTADRGLLIATVAWAGVLHLIWPQRVALRRVALALLVAIIAVGLLVTIVGNRYGGSINEHPEVAASLTTRSVDQLAIPYLYLTGNIPTFGQLTLDELAPVTHGEMTMLPLRKAADLLGAPGTPPVASGVFYPIPFESFSNYSWLGSFWLDFRLPGLILLPAMVLAVAAISERRGRRSPTLSSLWITSVFLYVIVFSPFANALSSPLPWQFLLLTPMVAIALDRRVGARAVGFITATRHSVRAVAAAAALVLGAGSVLTFSRLRTASAQPSASQLSFDPRYELQAAVEKAQMIYQERKSYPTPATLAGRLQVNRPDLSFRAQGSYLEPVPPAPGVIAVFSAPKDVFLRVRSSDGRIFEVHRTEDWGGVTFGPGTRDD